MSFVLAIIQPDGAALPSAVRWIEGALLGSVATGVAVLAVAFLGFGMLAGRLDWRTGLRVVLGVFILFGAPMIVQGLMGAMRDTESAAPDQAFRDKIPPAPKTPDLTPRSDPFDPNSGMVAQKNR